MYLVLLFYIIRLKHGNTARLGGSLFPGGCHEIVSAFQRSEFLESFPKIGVGGKSFVLKVLSSL